MLLSKYMWFVTLTCLTTQTTYEHILHFNSLKSTALWQALMSIVKYGLACQKVSLVNKNREPQE